MPVAYTHMKRPRRKEALKAAHLVERLERLTRRHELDDRLDPPQWQALRYLATANRFSRTPAALAAYLDSTPGRISRTVAGLKANGYVSRRSNGAGGGVSLALTPKAEKALKHDPLLDLALDIEDALGEGSVQLAQNLSALVNAALDRKSRRPFGLCASCRHFRRNAHASSPLPHHCALLDEPLAASDSRMICAEQTPP
jgi:DNA-binding MarR family transcriptional regulator